MNKPVVLLFLLEFLGFNFYLLYMYLWDPWAWLPLLWLLLGTLATAAYDIRSERRKKTSRFILWDDAGIWFDPKALGVVVKTGDVTHPTAIEVEFHYPDFAEC